MAGKITKRRVDAAANGSIIWDGEIRGFGLRVSAKGARTYVLKYRIGGVQRWLTIGRHGATWTPDTARREARKLLGEIQAGKDPAKEKSEHRAAESFAAFTDRYLSEYANVHKKASTVTDETRLLNKHVLPMLGKWKLRDITREDIKRFHLSMKHAPYSANRTLALLSHMFNTAEDWGLRAENSNPCRRVKKYEERSRERFLSQRELARLGRALAVVDRAGKAPYEAAAIRLLLFTGARLSEILTLEWKFVDFTARLLRLPDSKTGAKTIALPPPAIELLQSLERQEGNPFVICGYKEGAHLVNLQKPWRRIRKAAGLNDVRIHDLRHSFASVGAAGGMSLPLIGALLGHSQASTTHRYAHFADDPRLAAADKVAATIAAGLAGNTGNVVNLKARKA